MARKRSNPMDVPPAASSSDEEEEAEAVDDQDKEDDLPNAQHDESESEEEGEDDDEEDDDDDEEDEDDEEQAKKKDQSLQRPSQPKAITKSPNQQEDEEEDEDESKTESDSDSKSADFSIRPHFSDSAITSTKDSASVKLKKPTGNPSKDKEKENAKAKANESQLTVSVNLKRPAEGDIQINSKMKKVKSENGEQGVVAEKKPAFSRLWSEEDEIAVLKGMIEFHSNKGVDPNSDSIAFHEFVKKNISVDVSKSQLMEKVKRLKSKYKNNIEKGNNPVFSKPHEIKVFELSMRIWGGLGNTSNNKASKKKNLVVENAKPELVMALAKAETFQAVKNKKNKLNQQEERKVEEGKFSDLYPFLNMSLKMDNFLMSKYAAEGMKSCLVSLEKSKLDELEKEWEKQILDEAQVKLGRSALLQKQVQLVSEWCSKRG